MHAIELGSKVRDSVSGWTGIATARYEYLNGCERYEVSAHDKEGKPEGFTFDWQQIEVLQVPAYLQQPVASVPGGDRSNTPVAR